MNQHYSNATSLLKKQTHKSKSQNYNQFGYDKIIQFIFIFMLKDKANYNKKKLLKQFFFICETPILFSYFLTLNSKVYTPCLL